MVWTYDADEGREDGYPWKCYTEKYPEPDE